jgi:sulfur-oxidizing protein SoxX
MVACNEGAVVASLSRAPGDAQVGMTVISTAALGNCVACHQISAVPEPDFQGNIALPMDGVADR